MHRSRELARPAQWRLRERLRRAVKAQQMNANASVAMARMLQALCFIGRSRHAVHYREQQYES